MLVAVLRHRAGIFHLHRAPAGFAVGGFQVHGHAEIGVGNRGRTFTFAKMRQLLVVLLKHLFEHVIDLLNVVHYLSGRLSLSTQIPNNQ